MRIGIVASPATSLQTVAQDIKYCFEKKGHDCFVFDRRVPFFQAERMYSKAVFVMTFDPLYAKSWFLACRDYNKYGIESFVYTTTEGLPKKHLVTDWLKHEVPYVAVSKFVAKQLRRVGIHVIDVVHHGVNLELIELAKKEAPSQREFLKRIFGDKTVFGIVCGGHGRKGLDILNKVIQIVNEKTNDIGFYVLTNKEGRGYLYDITNTYADMTFGKRERTEVLNLMASFDFLLHPALTEGFGMVVLEAMALGIPTIHVDYEPLSEFSPSNLNFVIEPYELMITDFGDGIDYTCHIYRPELMAEAVVDAHELFRKKKESYDNISAELRKRAEKYKVDEQYLHLLKHLT